MVIDHLALVTGRWLRAMDGHTRLEGQRSTRGQRSQAGLR